jgi:hypothetical protein
MADERPYDVFVSYASKDRKWVGEFVSALREAGVHVWLDVDAVAFGDQWQRVAEEALQDSRTLVFVMTRHTVHSPRTFFELGAAIAGKKRVIPILTEEIDVKEIPALVWQFYVLREPSPREAAKRVAEAIAKLDAA